MLDLDEKIADPRVRWWLPGVLRHCRESAWGHRCRPSEKRPRFTWRSTPTR